MGLADIRAATPEPRSESKPEPAENQSALVIANGTEDPVADNAGNDFDVLVLGGGSGGYACAIRSAELGLHIGLIEQDKLGGTCLHRGCVPTKALLHAAEVADQIRDADQYGVSATLEGIDMAGVNKYKDGVVARAFKGLTTLLKGHGIEVIKGAGRLHGPRAVDVDDTTYTARNVVLATGSTPKTLPGLQIDGDRVITSDHALRLTDVPRSVVVLGGGVVGVEFASVWRSFGADVTIIEALPRLLPTEDEDSSTALERAFRRRDITVATSTSFDSVEHTGSGVRVRAGTGTVYDADLMLVGVGRDANTVDLGYAEAGVELERECVRTDERLRTSVEGVYAAGDLVAGPQLAHRGFAHGILVAEQIAGREPAPVEDSGVPRVTYCDPEVASIGLTEDQARKRYGADGIGAQRYDLAGNAKSQILKTQGFVKVIRAVEGPVVGVHLVGARVGELVGEAQLIYNWEAFPEEVAQLVHMHPTQTEAIGEAHMALTGRPLHTHG